MSTRIPINRAKINDFENKSMADMQADMETRRKEWEKEIEKMRQEFFTMNPAVTKDRFHTNAQPLFGDVKGQTLRKEDDGKPVIERGQDGQPLYRIRFDLADFKPENINVKTDDKKIAVTAKQQSTEGGRTVTREYNRELNIPPEVDSKALTCTMSNGGLLVVEAPMPTPTYKSIATSAFKPANIVVERGESRKTQPPTMTEKLISEKQASGVHTTDPASKQFLYRRSPVAPELRQSPITVDRKKNVYTIEVDIEDFHAENLNVKTVDNKLIVTASKEDTSGGRTSTKQMTREFNLPDDVEPTSVKAFLAESGKLVLEAPYRVK